MNDTKIEYNQQKTVSKAMTERIDTRLERKLDEMSSEIKELHKIVVSLQHINKSYEHQSTKNTDEIETLKLKFNRADGVIEFFKWFSGIALINIVGFGLWVNSNIHAIKPLERDVIDLKMRIDEHEKRIQHLEKKP